MTSYDDTVGEPMTVTVDPNGLDLVKTYLYDETTGHVTAVRQPANSTGGDAHETDTTYYAATGSTPCGGQPAYAGLVCQVGPAAQPGTSGLPNIPAKTYQSYNLYDQPLVTTDTSGSATRTTTDGYDAMGRLTSESVTGNYGAASVPTISYGYDPNTGLQTTQSAAGGGTVTTAYDAIGRVTSYTDADANTSTYGYDIDGRVKSYSDGKGTQSYSYDAVTGDLTALQDSGAGTFSAAYNPDGALAAETYPNGMSAAYTYDETGQATGLSYTKITNCSSGCTWFTDQAMPSIHAQWLSQQSSRSSQAYAYDAAGRLSQTEETIGSGSCSTRQYAYDKDSNRLGLTTIAGAQGSCSTSGGATAGHSYDAADRLSDAGVTYDPMGDSLTLPAADAGGYNLTNKYYVTNRLQSETQNGLTMTFLLDADNRIHERVASGTKSWTSYDHFSDNSDSPRWTGTGSSWTRDISGIGGEFVALQSSSGTITFELSDLHGDVVGSASSTATSPTLSQQTDEFGVPYQGISPNRFSYLGDKERSTSLSSGVMEMGEREYVPELGRFEQPDPVLGGSANSYDYVDQDPLNARDLSGRYWPGYSYAPACYTLNLIGRRNRTHVRFCEWLFFRAWGADNDWSSDNDPNVRPGTEPMYPFGRR